MMAYAFLHRALQWSRNQLARGYERIALRAERDLVRRLFDSAYYRDKYPDVRQSCIDPLTHFLLFGAREHRQPHPLFDLAYYMASNPDVAASGTNPLVHFLKEGWKQHRRPNPLFDPGWYAREFQLPEGVNPLLDYMQRRESREDVLLRRPESALLCATPPRFRVPTLAEPVDLIFLASDDPVQTRQGLESLADARFQTRFDVVIINPASDETELTRSILGFCEQHQWTCIDGNNPDPMGRAISAHSERDIVLFPAGTQAAGNWLDRLSAAAYSASEIGTATPFCNLGGPAGYPLLRPTATLPTNAILEEIDRHCELANGGATVDLGAPPDSLIYVRREYLTEGGSNDLTSSNVDWNVRGRRSSRWKHVLAGGVFVFQASRSGAAFPTANEVSAAYLGDPAAAFRFAVSASRLRSSGIPVILAITHALGGGISESLHCLRQDLRNRAEFVVATPAESAIILECPNPDYAFSLALDPEREYSILLEALRRCGLVRMHIHHVHGHRLDLQRLHRDLQVPFDFTVHDYYSICPQFHLIKTDGSFCGEPGEDTCNQCIAERPTRPPRTIQEWRREHDWLLRGADRLIAPSLDTATRLARYIPERAALVAPHPESLPPRSGHDAPFLRANEPLRIAILGVLAKHKGLERVRECARRAKRSRLPLEFVLIGYVDKSLRPRPEPFRKTGPYTMATLADVLGHVKPHLVWFPGEAPETYSFALSGALRARLPLVVPDIGAMPERVAGVPWTWIIAPDWSVSSVNAFFVEIRERNFLPHLPPNPSLRLGALEAGSGFYESAYLEGGAGSLSPPDAVET